MSRIRAYFNWLIGSSKKFELEARVYHLVAIILTLSGIICVPINYLLSDGPLYLLFLAVTCLGFILFYISRFKGLYHISVMVFQIYVNASLVMNYYYNSGSEGPTYTLFLLNLLLSVVMTPRKQHYLWLVLNLVLIIGLLTYERLYLNAIPITYKSDPARYLDLITSYLVMAAFVFIIALFVRKAYNKKRDDLTAQKSALEAAIETKNKLLSVVSHDLNGPLASLQSYLELLQSEDLNEIERKEMNDILLSMTRNTSAMLSNILAWTTTQGNRFQVQQTDFQVAPALANLLEVAGGISTRKQIRIHNALESDAVVHADRHMFELVVRNLLMNALKFTSKGGTIELKAVTERGQSVITVKDNGIGIPRELQRGLFSLTASSTRWGTAAEKGAGLGLRLCRDFTDLMGGRLSFISEEGQGTTFTLVLPAGQLPFTTDFPVLENEMMG